ncbi:MAG: response regulator [Candidatus Sericytochromatia bacterium]|nr:response regulator [Candidatus Sericytochromatia bacterium]
MIELDFDKELIALNIIPKKILIAEDDIINVFLLERILRPLNFEVIVAADGVEAISKFKQFNFDLILMDIYMPNMNGIEASIIIREISKTIPIIVISAAVLNTENLIKETGVNYFMAKPIEVYSFKKLLHKIFLS